MSKLEQKTGSGDWEMVYQTFEDLGFDSMLKEKTWSKMLNGCETHRLKILTKWLPPNADEPN